MEKQTHENIMTAVESSSVQTGRNMETIQVAGTLQDSSPMTSTISKVGTALVLQNDIQVSDVSRMPDEFSLNDENWNYKAMTSKPYVNDTLLWSGTYGTGYNLLDYKFPNDYFTANHVLKTVGETFLSVRGDLHFVVTVQGTPIAAGALVIAPDYWPYSGSNSLKDILVRQKAIINVSDNSATADLVVPFRWVRNGADPFDDVIRVGIWVLSPLTGMNSVNVTISCFLENQEFKFMRPLEVVAVRRTQGKVEEKVTQGLIDVTTINNTLSHIQEATLPMEMKGDQLDVTGTLMDDVGMTTNPQAVVVKFNSLNNADNPHYIEKMALVSRSQRVATSDTFNTMLDDMSMKEIVSRESYLTTFKISSTTATGFQKINSYVTPTVLVANGVSAGEQVDLLGAVADKFQFWRGGLKYRFRFFMNRFQSVKLYFGMFYKAVTPSTFSDWSASHGAIVDVGGDQTEVIVEIPYQSETPWLNVPHGPLVLLNPNDTSLWTDYALGTLGVYCLTPLITPEGSPQEISCIMTVSGADDFELANYSTSATIHDDFAIPRGTEGSVVLARKSKPVPNYITDVVHNYKQLMSKWQYLSIDYDNAKNSPVSNYATYLAVFPQDMINPYVNNIATSTVGRTTVEAYPMAPLNNIIHSHYSGGLKLLITLSVYTETGAQARPEQFRPKCFFLNPDGADYNFFVQRSVAINKITNAINSYAAITQYFATPYMVREVNRTANTVSFTYEIEIPYQRALKYAPCGGIGNERFTDYGVVLCGFEYVGGIDKKAPEKAYWWADVYGKIADDGRFSTLERGSFTISQKNWNL